MRLRTTAILATAAFGLAIPASGLAEVSTTIGTGKTTCVLKPGADCRGVVHRWGVEHHGNLRKAKFTGAHLHGADFRGADLRGVHFHGAKLHHADFRQADLRGARFHGAKLRGADFSGARLKGAHFGPSTTTRKGANQAQPATPCYPKCSGADLSGANLTGADLSRANLSRAFLLGANLTSANLSGANLNSADLTRANLSGANLSRAILYQVWWSNTTCPNGTVTINTGCW
jgi:uncharacterized protein YjbI with pentapeptide repeats